MNLLVMHKNITQRYVTKRMDVKIMATRKGIRGSPCGIGDRSLTLRELSDKEFMKEINRTKSMFQAKFPELSNITFEYNKQCTLLQLDFWYQKPLPTRCERFFEAEVISLLNNVDEESEEGMVISQLCQRLLSEYLPLKYSSQDV
jgi:hypothetical protein